MTNQSAILISSSDDLLMVQCWPLEIHVQKKSFTVYTIAFSVCVLQAMKLELIPSLARNITLNNVYNTKNSKS